LLYPIAEFYRTLLPLSIGIIINRTLVYGSLTVALSPIYIGCIVVSRILVVPLTGGSELATVISTLVIVALFTPFRRRIQNMIDKRSSGRRCATRQT